MPLMSGEDSRIRDGVRDSKIRLDILWEHNQKLGSLTSSVNQGTTGIQNSREQYQSHCGRVLPRSSKGVEDCTYVGRLERNRSRTAGVARRDISREANRRWVRLYLPILNGTANKEDLFDWIDTVDRFFEQTQPPEQMKCELASYAFEGEAERWWKQLQHRRLLDGEPEIRIWPRMKFLLINDFWPSTCSINCPTRAYNNRLDEKGTHQSPNEFPFTMEVTSTTGIYVRQIENGKREKQGFTPTRCSINAPFEPYLGKQDGNETHSSGSMHIIPKHEDTASIDNEVKSDSHGMAKVHSKEETKAITAPRNTLMQVLGKTKMEELEVVICGPDEGDYLVTEEIEEYDDIEDDDAMYEGLAFLFTSEIENGENEADFELKKHTSTLISASVKLAKEEAGLYKPKLECTDHFAVYEDLHGIEKPKLMNRLSKVMKCSPDDNIYLTFLSHGKCMTTNYSIGEIRLLLFDPGGRPIFQKIGTHLFPNYELLFDNEVAIDDSLLNIAHLESVADVSVSVMGKPFVFVLSGSKGFATSRLHGDWVFKCVKRKSLKLGTLGWEHKSKVQCEWEHKSKVQCQFLVRGHEALLGVLFSDALCMNFHPGGMLYKTQSTILRLEISDETIAFGCVLILQINCYWKFDMLRIKAANRSICYWSMEVEVMLILSLIIWSNNVNGGSLLSNMEHILVASLMSTFVVAVGGMGFEWNIKPIGAKALVFIIDNFYGDCSSKTTEPQLDQLTPIEVAMERCKRVNHCELMCPITKEVIFCKRFANCLYSPTMFCNFMVAPLMLRSILEIHYRMVVERLIVVLRGKCLVRSRSSERGKDTIGMPNATLSLSKSYSQLDEMHKTSPYICLHPFMFSVQSAKSTAASMAGIEYIGDNEEIVPMNVHLNDLLVSYKFASKLVEFLKNLKFYNEAHGFAFWPTIGEIIAAGFQKVTSVILNLHFTMNALYGVTVGSNITRVRFILWEAWNDENDSNTFIMTKGSVVTISSCLGILFESGHIKSTVKLFHKLVNGLDPPKDFKVSLGDSMCGNSHHLSSMDSLVDELSV